MLKIRLTTFMILILVIASCSGKQESNTNTEGGEEMSEENNESTKVEETTRESSTDDGKYFAIIPDYMSQVEHDNVPLKEDINIPAYPGANVISIAPAQQGFLAGISVATTDNQETVRKFIERICLVGSMKKSFS